MFTEKVKSPLDNFKENMDTEVSIEWEEDPHVFVFKEEVPGKVKMHVKRLDLNNWVRIDKTYPFQMEARRKLYETNMADIFVSKRDESTRNCKLEFFELLIEHLLDRFPQIFERRGSCVYNKVTKMSISTEADDLEDPLLRAGRLTQEDWLILEYDPDQLGYVLTAAVLCFPMSWKLKEKFNKVMNSIHKPVMPYQTHLKDKVAALFFKMTPQNSYWRSNWGIYAGLKSPYDLFVHSSANKSGEIKEFPFEGYDTGHKMFLRCEYQTLRKLPKTKCIVFGIRTYQRYLHELLDLPIDVSETLRTAIENLDEEFLDYKNGEVWEKATVQYLDLIITDRNQRLSLNGNFSEGFKGLAYPWFLQAFMFMSVAAMSLYFCKTISRRL